jgi:hypothetical protein
MLLLLCLSLLSATASRAQQLSRPSPFTQGYGSQVSRQVVIDRMRPPVNLPRVFVPNVLVPRDPFVELHRVPAVQSVVKTWQTPRTLTVQPIAQVPVRRPIATISRDFISPIATVAATPKSSVRKVDEPRLIVRANPRSWYLGALEQGDKFKVKAVRGAWAYGDASGDINRKNVWVLRDGLTKGNVPSGKGNPPYTIRNHDQSRAYMLKKEASWLSPGKSDGVKVKLTSPTVLSNTYNPKTGDFLGRVKTLDPKTPNREVRVRYISKDGNAAVVRYNGVKENGKSTKMSQWGVVPCAQLRTSKGGKLPCHSNTK